MKQRGRLKQDYMKRKRYLILCGMNEEHFIKCKVQKDKVVVFFFYLYMFPSKAFTFHIDILLYG